MPTSYVSIYLSIYIYIYICIYIYMYVCIYIYIYIESAVTNSDFSQIGELACKVISYLKAAASAAELQNSRTC